jgi:polyvinyl alcohol dehydrogenase (cytochrome)
MITGLYFRFSSRAIFGALLLSGAMSRVTAQAVSGTAPTCTGAQRSSASSGTTSWTRWGGDVNNRRAAALQPISAGGDSLVLRWAFNVGAVATVRSQPAVAAGRVFATSESGMVWALDLERGCVWWQRSLDVPARSSVVLELDAKGAPRQLFVGDLTGHVRALDATTGASTWSTKVDTHAAAIVTGTPQLHAGVLYVPVSSYESALALQPKYPCCTFRGSIVALDARSGRMLWQRYTIDDTATKRGTSKSGAETWGPSGAAVWSTPTVDVKRGRIYVGTGNNYSEPTTARSDAIIALDSRTGAIVWSRQFTAKDGYNSSCDMPGKYNCPAADGPDHDFGQPPMLVDLGAGKRALVIGAKSGMLRAIDPDRDGATLWEREIGPGGKLGGLHWGSATDGRRVFAAYGGQSIDPIPDKTTPLGVRLVANRTVGGGLFAVDVRTGAIVWRAAPPVCDTTPGCSPAQSAAVTVAHGVVWSGALDGHLRGYDVATGRVTWDEPTARVFTAVNGGQTRGGSLDAGGPVIVGNTLLVGSGYALHGAMPGNVLLAYTRVPRRR